MARGAVSSSSTRMQWLGECAPSIGRRHNPQIDRSTLLGPDLIVWDVGLSMTSTMSYFGSPRIDLTGAAPFRHKSASGKGDGRPSGRTAEACRHRTLDRSLPTADGGGDPRF